ncbi:hypothetical protein O181_069625 [Austropuccinia psidii MF-1]|uniref:Crossover junction endonuclease MUS81 n=1 Tax=Austropuccinia psidii MF-1 TaxID=1389203 RepID=A0A9Q3F3A6_9BASI|nr:hypothetical protein [Austropuccinia psidii MF-1]
MPPRKVYPNLEWAAWVQELADLAAEKNSRAAETYRKAAKSIKTHPEKLLRPKDAMFLPGVGPKIVKALTDKLEKLAKENSTSLQVSPAGGSLKRGLSLDDSFSSASSKHLKRASIDLQNKPGFELEGQPPGIPLGNVSTSLSALEQRKSVKESIPARAKCGAARTKRSYFPKSRDPAWGILAAMYSFCETTDLKKFSSKETIIEGATPYCDSSYTISNKNNTNRYRTAWNSGIDILLKHQLVISHAALRPLKYALTASGYEVALVVARKEGIPILDLHLAPDQSSLPNPIPMHPQLSNEANTTASSKLCHYSNKAQLTGFNNESLGVKSLSDGIFNKALDKPTNSSISYIYLQNPTPFNFFYVDFAGCRVRELAKAATRPGATSHESYHKIEFYARQQLHPFCVKNVLIDTVESNITLPRISTMIGWLKSDKSIPTCPGFAVTDLAETCKSNFNQPCVSTTTGSYPAPFVDQTKTALTSSGIIDGIGITAAIVNGSGPTQSTRPKPMSQSEIPLVQSAHGCSLASTALSNGIESSSQLGINGNQPDAFARSRASFATKTFLPSEMPQPSTPSGGSLSSLVKEVQAELWKAGTYGIMLVIDNREVKSRRDRDGMFNLCLSRMRQSMGSLVKVQQRPLAVGDALWIAINNVSSREVVLDSIVERKRLDDLGKSILDSRFHEQKARLKSSGLKDRIYLIESFNVQVNNEQFDQRIQTSQVELMLLDDCHLQATTDWKESVEYLVMRTQVLYQLHQSIDLSVIPDKHINRSSYLPLLYELRRTHPEKYWVTSYSVFESLNSKSGNSTVKELWGKMIHQVNGMSAEKVGEFVSRWPTPRLFWDEFNEQYLPVGNSQVKENENQQLASLRSKWVEDQFSSSSASSRRTLGPILSKMISNLFALDSY